MAGAIADKTNQVPGTATISLGGIREALRQHRVTVEADIQLVTEQLDDRQVAPLVIAADVVALAHLAALQDQLDTAAVILHIQPVANVAAIPVDGQLATAQDIGQAQGNQFLREVPGSVVVGAVAGGHLQAIRMVPGPHQVVRSRLAGRVGRVGLVLQVLAKGRIVRAQGAVNLVGGDVVKTVLPRTRVREPVLPGRLEQGVRAHDIGLDKGIRPGDRTVDVAFGGEVHQGIDAIFTQGGQHRLVIADVRVHEVEAGFRLQRRQVGAVASVGQGIQRNQGVTGVSGVPVVHEVGANKAGGAGHQQ